MEPTLQPDLTAARTLARQTLDRLRAGELQGCTRLDLRGCGLVELPA